MIRSSPASKSYRLQATSCELRTANCPHHVSARSALTPAPISAVSSSGWQHFQAEKLCSGLIFTIVSMCARSSGSSTNPTLCPVK